MFNLRLSFHFWRFFDRFAHDLLANSVDQSPKEPALSRRKTDCYFAVSSRKLQWHSASGVNEFLSFVAAIVTGAKFRWTPVLYTTYIYIDNIHYIRGSLHKLLYIFDSCSLLILIINKGISYFIKIIFRDYFWRNFYKI